MRKNKFDPFTIIRPIMLLLPLMFGSPFISFCLCAFNAAMTIIGSGPLYGVIIESITAASAVFACVSAGRSTAYGVLFALQIVLASLACAACIITKRSFGTGLMLTSAAYGIPFLGGLKYEADEVGLSIADNMLSVYLEPMRGSFDTLLVQSGFTQDDAQRFFDVISDSFRIILPSALIIIAVVGGYAVMWMVSRPLRSTEFGNGHSFGNIRLSLFSVIYAVIMGLLLFVPDERVSVIAVNGLVIFAFMAFAAGISLLDFLMRIKIPGYITRILIHGAVLFFGLTSGFSMLLLVYIAAGIVDCFVSVRKRVTSSDENKPTL